MVIHRSIFRFSLIVLNSLWLTISNGNSLADTTKQYYEITGKVLKREEIWDRRSNPLMGRPDWLKEIILEIEIDSILKTDAVRISGIIKATAKEESLHEFSQVMEGEIGIFSFEGNVQEYFLLNFDTIPGNKGKVNSEKTNITTISKTQIQNESENEKMDDSLRYYESIRGKDIADSKSLQKKAVKFIGKRFNLKNTEFVTITSYSGPAPPDGGYVYWGVRGQKSGKWYIWQAGYGDFLQEGKELNDPKRYQKCNSPETKISTPKGEIAIQDLKKGDTVYTANLVPVRLLDVSKVQAGKHRVCHVVFENGTIIDISPNHPLANGKLFNNLQAGDKVDGVKVISNTIILYSFEYTYDILPDSEAGTYFVGGIEIGSTMK